MKNQGLNHAYRMARGFAMASSKAAVVADQPLRSSIAMDGQFNSLCLKLAM